MGLDAHRSRVRWPTCALTRAVGAITPCGQCRACLSGHAAQCGREEGYRPLGGWRFGNTIDGAQAEYLLVPDATANLPPIPDDVSDEQGAPGGHRIDGVRRTDSPWSGSRKPTPSSESAATAC